MKQLNTLPIENFINLTRIASKSRQNNVVLDIKDAVQLSDSLAIVMTRLAGNLDEILQKQANQSSEEAVIQVNMDGGGFK